MTASTLYPGHGYNGPDSVINGIVSSIDKDFFRSGEEIYPWLLIDLKAPKFITSVKVFGPNGAHNTVLNTLKGKQIEVRVGLSNFVEKKKQITSNEICWNSTFTGMPNEELHSYCNYEEYGLYGRYISVQMVNPEDISYLMVSEVVWFSRTNVTSFELQLHSARIGGKMNKNKTIC